MSTITGSYLSGRYRLENKIGSGGMSTVFCAFDETLERRVAIKLMHREIASDSAQLERFRREARAVAQLSHPHIVGVIDAGEDDRTPDDEFGRRPYIVFEYINGETLKDRIRQAGRLPIVEALAYAIEIAQALGCAHSRGIVHRDVKPQNVLIDAEGSAKVTDFGIARSLDEDGLTADGRVLGTTDYVSPEQALGHDVSGQSDIYSLGVVLYEMLTGNVPFVGENQVAVAMKHVREELPDIQMRRSEVSASLASMLDRATAKQLDRRYQTINAMIVDLENVLAIETGRAGQPSGELTTVLRGLPAEARERLPLRTRFSFRWLIAVLAVAAIALTVISFGLIGRTQRGTGSEAAPPPAPGLKAISLSQTAAHDYDPFGGDGEHSGQVNAVLDREPASAWSTERYNGGLLSKPGVGLYVDAHPGVAARALVVRSPDRNWKALVYATKSSSAPRQLADWTAVSSTIDVTRSRMKFALDTAGQRFRYYLVWITKVPPQGGSVRISELSLYH